MTSKTVSLTRLESRLGVKIREPQFAMFARDTFSQGRCCRWSQSLPSLTLDFSKLDVVVHLKRGHESVTSSTSLNPLKLRPHGAATVVSRLSKTGYQQSFNE